MTKTGLFSFRVRIYGGSKVITTSPTRKVSVIDPPKVRHSNSLVLNSDLIDLDSVAADWSRSQDVTKDLNYSDSYFRAYNGSGILAVPAGTASYSVCRSKTAYSSYVKVQDLKANSSFCVKTRLGRYGAIRMTEAWSDPDTQPISIVIWEPIPGVTPPTAANTGPFNCAALSSGATAVRHCDNLVLNSDLIDLDSVAADWSRSQDVTKDLNYSDTYFRAYNGAGILPIPSGAPSYATCSTRTNYSSYAKVQDLNNATMFCVKTRLGRYGAIRMTEAWSDPDTQPISIVIWEPKS
jgi:hypothetical protein